MKKFLLLAIGLICLPLLARADGFTIIGSRAAQNPTDIIDWSQLGAAGTQLATPQLVFTFGGNAALVGNNNGSNFNRVDEGNGWTGNFDYGETLVWTGNSNFPGTGGSGPFAMEFQNPVGSFGFSIEDNALGDPFSVTVQIFDPSLNLLGTETFSGLQTNNPALENGSAPFIGVGDTSGVNIGAIIISTTDSTNPSFSNDFAMDDPSFTYTASPTPEPGTILLLGTGLIGLAGHVRRRFRV